MKIRRENSDGGLLDLLRNRGALGISDLTSAMQVTRTAVRQRLARLMAQGLVLREPKPAVRGRPSHRYLLTDKGRRIGGSNFSDLTMALWQEVRAIKDPVVRSGLLRRIAKVLAEQYRRSVQGQSTSSRMEQIAQLMAERDVHFSVEQKSPADRTGSLPVLTAHACPYPELAEQDRGICGVERMLFSELLEQNVRLSECRLDGASCCRFETN